MTISFRVLNKPNVLGVWNFPLGCSQHGRFSSPQRGILFCSAWLRTSQSQGQVKQRLHPLAACLGIYATVLSRLLCKVYREWLGDWNSSVLEDLYKGGKDVPLAVWLAFLTVKQGMETLSVHLLQLIMEQRGTFRHGFVHFPISIQVSVPFQAAAYSHWFLLESHIMLRSGDCFLQGSLKD